MTQDDPYGADIFTEPEPGPDTLKQLGPLAALAGIWEGTPGRDVHLEVQGSVTEPFTERWEIFPGDAQMNGPQLLFPLRYHHHVVRPGEVQTFHDQVGYLLWEPEANQVMMTLAIPRGQVALACGPVESGDTEFTLHAEHGDPYFGISSNPFLARAYHTSEWTITFTIHDDGSWSYDQDTVLHVTGQDAPFHHVDSGHLYRVAPAAPNPVMR